MAKSGIIVSYYFPPSGGGGVQRWSKFIKYLSQEDWQFTVITKKTNPNDSFDENILNELPESLKIIRINDCRKITSISKAKSNFSFWQRWLSAFYYITDSRKAWNNILWDELIQEIETNQYDVVILTIPPYSLAEVAGKLTQKYKKLPVVLDMRDPWSINPYKIHPTFLHKKLDEKNEFSAISKINNIVAAYESTLEYYKNSISDFKNKNVSVIANGHDEEDFIKLIPEKNETAADLNIAFSGTFYSHLNNPKNLFKAIAQLKSEGDIIHFHHIGDSVIDVKKLAIKYGIEKQVKLYGYLPHKRCINVLMSMDAFVVILDDGIKNAEKTAGGKLYEYLFFKKPILGIVPQNGEAANVINKADSGIVCSYQNINEIADALKKLKSGQFRFQGIDEFNRKKQAHQLNDFLKKCMNYAT